MLQMNTGGGCHLPMGWSRKPGWSRILKGHLTDIFFFSFCNAQGPFSGGENGCSPNFPVFAYVPTWPQSCSATNRTEAWETRMWREWWVTSDLGHFVVTAPCSVPPWRCPSSLHGETGAPEIKAQLVPESLCGEESPGLYQTLSQKKK